MLYKDRPLSGRYLWQARRDHGLNQSELAELLGISVTSIKNWEAGRYPVGSPILLCALEEHLDIDISIYCAFYAEDKKKNAQSN